MVRNEFSKTYNCLNNEFLTLCLISQDETFDKFKFCELMGKINFAAENHMITIDEWDNLFVRVAKRCR